MEHLHHGLQGEGDVQPFLVLKNIVRRHQRAAISISVCSFLVNYFPSEIVADMGYGASCVLRICNVSLGLTVVQSQFLPVDREGMLAERVGFVS
jgi:hypothetical protein